MANIMIDWKSEQTTAVVDGAEITITPKDTYYYLEIQWWVYDQPSAHIKTATAESLEEAKALAEAILDVKRRFRSPKVS